MKTTAIFGGIFLLALGLATLTGCGKPSPSQIQLIITDATEAAVSLGLHEIADPVAAKVTAGLIVDNVAAARQALSGTLPTGAILQDLLSAKLLNNVPLEVQLAIKTASLLLSEYIQVPSDTTYLTANEILYLNAFLDGIENGAKGYAAHMPQVRKAFIRCDHK